MAMGPRMDPFPWETYFIDERVLTDQQQLDALNSHLNDGVQFNINLGGYPGSWEHEWVSYAPGLIFPPENDTFYATRVPEIPYAAIRPVTPQPWVPSGLELDPWGGAMGWIGDSSMNLYNHPENIDPVLKQRYTSTEMRYGTSNGASAKGPIPTAGVHTYPGVFGIIGRDMMEPVWCNAPIGIEYWFSENPNRSDPTIGYSGYTAFGDQGNAYFNTYQFREIPDMFVRKIVVGMVRTAASMDNPSTTEMMCGVIVTYNGTSTTVQACTNGEVRWENTYARTFHPDDFNFWWESAWGGDADPAIPYEHWTGWMDDFEIYIQLSAEGVFPTVADFRYITSYDNAVSDPEAIYTPSYDTYDIKHVLYMDAYSPSYPVNQPVPRPSRPTEPLTLYSDSINMYTNHHWTVPVGYTNATSPISTDVGYVSGRSVITNNYVVDVGSITTPNIGITSIGEISLVGGVGARGDTITTTGPESPATWNATIKEYNDTLDALLVRLAAAEAAGG